MLNPKYDPAFQVYNKTNYTSTTADTTSYIPIPFFSELGFVVQSTDSAGVDVYFDGKNSGVAAVVTTYADSLVTTNNAGSFTSVVIKSPTLNRLPNENLVRFRVISRSSSAGTTAGRTLRIYRVSKSP